MAPEACLLGRNQRTSHATFLSSHMAKLHCERVWPMVWGEMAARHSLLDDHDVAFLELERMAHELPRKVEVVSVFGRRAC